METTIWVVVKIMVPFWVPKYEVPYYNGDPKRGHNFENYPARVYGSGV